MVDVKVSASAPAVSADADEEPTVLAQLAAEGKANVYWAALASLAKALDKETNDGYALYLTKFGRPYNKATGQPLDKKEIELKGTKVRIQIETLAGYMEKLADEQERRGLGVFVGDNWVFYVLVNNGVSNDINNYLGGDRGASSMTAFREIPPALFARYPKYFASLKSTQIPGGPPMFGGGRAAPMFGGGRAPPMFGWNGRSPPPRPPPFYPPHARIRAFYPAPPPWYGARRTQPLPF